VDKNEKKLDGDVLREIFETVLPEQHLNDLIHKAKFEERSRKRDAVAFIRAMVIAAATGYGGRQRDVARVYFENGSPKVARGGFYAWFGPELEVTMAAVARRAIVYAALLPLDLPPLMATFARDFHIVDSSTVRLPDELFDEYPGTGDYAALKVHKRFSVGLGTLVDYHLSPAREHDSKHLKIDETWRGLGLLVDLGYASLQRLCDCETHGVVYVVRLKENWKPRVDQINRGEVTATFLAGSDLGALLDDGALLLGGRVVDATVTVGPPGRTVRCRLVGVPGPDGEYHFYLTNLPRSLGPRQVADFYRVRWEIESDNKLDKSCSHLDAIAARTGPAARALVHASLTSSMLACLIVHRHRLSERPPPAEGTERTSPPLHPQSVARAMAGTALRIAATLALDAEKASAEWQKIADYVYHLGRDPNWRSRPSVLDQMRGWRTSPGRPRRARIAASKRRGKSAK
jgi:Transposase DDE domain